MPHTPLLQGAPCFCKLLLSHVPKPACYLGILTLCSCFAHFAVLQVSAGPAIQLWSRCCIHCCGCTLHQHKTAHDISSKLKTLTKPIMHLQIQMQLPHAIASQEKKESSIRFCQTLVVNMTHVEVSISTELKAWFADLQKAKDQCCGQTWSIDLQVMGKKQYNNMAKGGRGPNAGKQTSCLHVIKLYFKQSMVQHPLFCTLCHCCASALSYCATAVLHHCCTVQLLYCADAVPHNCCTAALTWAGLLVKKLAILRKGLSMGVCCHSPVNMTPGCNAKAWMLLPCVLQQQQQGKEVKGHTCSTDMQGVHASCLTAGRDNGC